MKRLLLPCLALLIAPATAVFAQPAPDENPLARSLFPPELVMRYGSEIGLDERQRAAIKEIVQKAQAQSFDVQWGVQAETERLVRLLQARPVDEAAALSQSDKVLALEREVKRIQLALLVRIKNLLSEDQQAKLGELRRKGQ